MTLGFRLAQTMTWGTCLECNRLDMRIWQRCRPIPWSVRSDGRRGRGWVEDRIKNHIDWRLPSIKGKRRKDEKLLSVQQKGQFTYGWHVTGKIAASKQVLRGQSFLLKKKEKNHLKLKLRSLANLSGILTGATASWLLSWPTEHCNNTCLNSTGDVLTIITE